MAIYEISGTGTPNKKPYKWGLLKYSQKVTARKQPKVTGEPCSFSPIAGLTKIEVCDQITDKSTGRVWCYCRVNGLYGFILHSSIRDYLRTPGQSLGKVAHWVIDNDFGTLETRQNTLSALGYNPDAVQAEVNEILGVEPSDKPKFCVWAVDFMEDCARSTASDVVIRKLKAHGVRTIDAICISHAHGDHYGGIDALLDEFTVNHIYIPDVTELDRYQKAYASATKRQARKAPSTYLKAGTGFSVGGIKCKCVFIAPAAKLKEHDSHHFVNNESMVLRFDLGGVIFHTAGDLQNEGNDLLVKAVTSLKAHIFKVQWHGDKDATNEALCKAVRPKYAYSNYHNKPTSNGRENTRKRLQAVGTTFHDNYTFSDIFYHIQDGRITVETAR